LRFSATVDGQLGRLTNGEANAAKSSKLSSVHQLADRFGVSEKSIRRLKDAGQIGYHKIGGQIRFSEEQIETYLKSIEVDVFDIDSLSQQVIQLLRA
jgi:excisionase family DNA binding protein